MNRILYIICFLVLISIQNINSQISDIKYEDDLFVYWFHIRANVKPEKVTSRPVYTIRIDETKPCHGSLYDYELNLWKQIKRGEYIPIGPFLDFYDALEAMETYRNHNPVVRKNLSASILKEHEKKDEYYWYFLTFKITKRKKYFSLKRIPAAVAAGSLDEFNKVLEEGLTWKRLAIGPFPSQIEAEESKRINRLEEAE